MVKDTNSISTMCPVCLNNITITGPMLDKAVFLENQFVGACIVPCPECCTGLVLPDAPVDATGIAAYISKYDNPDDSDWLKCIPLLDPSEAKMPNGKITEMGITKYTPGDDTTPLTWVEYMTDYGIDPACALAKMERGLKVYQTTIPLTSTSPTGDLVLPTGGVLMVMSITGVKTTNLIVQRKGYSDLDLPLKAMAFCQYKSLGNFAAGGLTFQLKDTNGLHHNIFARLAGTNQWLVWMKLTGSETYNYSFQFKFIPATQGIKDLMQSEMMQDFLGIDTEGF